jgi:sugar phosphate isomerase/epimerase
MSSLAKQIYVSTGTFDNKTLLDILAFASQNDINAIELSSGVNYAEDMQPILLKASHTDKFKFLIHNYFPPPQIPFVLNLASDNNEIVDLSCKHCKKAIKMAAELGAPFYSVHSGFCFHAEPKHLGKDQTQLKRISKKEAENIFIENLQNLADFAALKGVKLLVENNVVSPFNLINGKNELLLGVTADEIKGIMDKTSRDNLGLLLDVGHLKVSANALGFCPEDFIRQVSDRIKAVHLSDNNGQNDSHNKIHTKSWFWKPLFEHISSDIIWILETHSVPMESITEQVALIHTMISNKYNMRPS